MAAATLYATFSFCVSGNRVFFRFVSGNMSEKKIIKPIASPGRKRTRLSTEARREQLLRSAVRMCADVGISRVSHADIANDVKVSVATVFVYFPTRQALIDEILKEVRRYLLEIMLSVSRDTPARVTVFGLLWECIKSSRSEPQYMRVWLEWGSVIRDDLRPRYLAIQEESTAMIRGILEKGQKDGNVDPRLDIDMAARMLAEGSRSVAAMVFSDLDSENLESLVWNWVDGALQMGLSAPYAAKS